MFIYNLKILYSDSKSESKMKIFPTIFVIVILNLQLMAQGNFSVHSFQPAAQSMNYLPTAEIIINFNSIVDVNSFNDTTFQVWGRWSGVHTGTISFYNDTTSLLFTPDENFFYGEWVTVSLSIGIKDTQGNHLATGFAWNFWIRTLPGTMNLTRTQTINVRQSGEGWIQTYGTYAGDLDGDGWSDFIVPNEIPADVRSTNEGFDYNLDGLMDFTVGNSTNNKVTVFSGDGTGSFSSIQNFNADNGIRGLVILDADGDGFPDIVTANRDANNASILLNNGNGTFSSPLNFEGNGDGETAAATSDVNGDGIMDLFLGAIYSDEVMLWLGDGNGSFTFSDEVAVGNGPWMVGSGDVNNDGIPDVVCANSSGSSFSVVLCDSAGNLNSPTNYPVGAFPLSVDLGDVDGDLDLDIVTSNFSGGNFTLYENDGTGVFINRNDLPSNEAGSCAVFHDRDNDGDMDMTGIDELQDLLILFKNDSTTSVNTHLNYPTEYALLQNHPNPFNPSTKIKYFIPELSFVTIKVFDSLGKDVATLVNEEKPVGSYEIDFNAIGLTSGVYFYRLQAGNFVETKRMVLLK
jgi:hypothetical protein